MKDKWKSGWRWWIRHRLPASPLGALKDIYWWFMHRTFKRYDRVKLRFLTPAYYDKDTMLIHAMFTLLCDFMEREKPGEIINWESDPDHSFAWKEMQDLYKWWKESYLKRREPIHDVPDDQIPDLKDLNKSQELCPVWHEACQQTMELEKKWAKEDLDNMHRLVAIHRYLWT
jgi:hypothetical protein